MSFTTDIKEELSQMNNLVNKEAVKFELLGYLISGNTVEYKKNIKYSTESEYNINRYAKLLRNVNIENFSIEIQGKIFNIEVKKQLLDNVKIFNEYSVFEFDLKNSELKKEENEKALIRGIFLGSGSINNPENKYHLEMNVKNEENIIDIIKIVENHNIKLKTIDKSIYIKDGEEISKFLAFIGASKSVIKFEEVRVQRHMNNKINRLVNCKTANLNKVLNASVEQIEAINKLKKEGKFQMMDESLKELAELRLEHPDMPLSELGNLLKKPIGKSGVNYRLKKIIELSK